VTEVPLPTQFGLEYEDLVLTTSDDVKIRCYLMVQKRPSDEFGKEYATDEEVSACPPIRVDESDNLKRGIIM
jgi:hypothetical protein